MMAMMLVMMTSSAASELRPAGPAVVLSDTAIVPTTSAIEDKPTKAVLLTVRNVGRTAVRDVTADVSVYSGDRHLPEAGLPHAELFADHNGPGLLPGQSVRRQVLVLAPYYGAQLDLNARISPPTATRAFPAAQSVSQQAEQPLSAELVESMYTPFLTAQGKSTYRFGMRWKNTGTRPVRRLVVNVAAFNADGSPNAEASYPKYVIYLGHPQDPGLLPGQTHTVAGPILFPTETARVDRKATKVTVAAVDDVGKEIVGRSLPERPNKVDVRVTLAGVKKAGDKYQYSFDVRNYDAKRVKAEVRVWLVDNWTGMPIDHEGKADFDAPAAPDSGRTVSFDARIGPVEKKYGMAVFRYTVSVGDETVARGEGAIPAEKAAKEWPYKFYSTKAEAGPRKDVMDLYAFDGEIDEANLKAFCSEKKAECIAKKKVQFWYMVVIFDRPVNAKFPTLAFTAGWSKDEEAARHIRAEYHYSPLNGHSGLKWHPLNTWQNTPREASID